MKITGQLCALILMGVVLQGCSVRGNGSSQNSNVGGATIASVEISPSVLQIANGTSQQFRATAIYANGTKADITQGVTWTSSDSQAVTVGNAPNQAGLAVALKTGKSTITASIQGISAIANLTASSATPSQLEVGPINPSLVTGADQQLSAIALFSDGTRQDVTESATWGTADSAIVSVSNAPGSQGLLQAVSQGQTSAVAAFMGMTASVDTQVTSATLQRIDVLPGSSAFANGTAIQVKAIGVFTDNTTKDLTDFVTWSVSNSAILSITATADSPTQAVLGLSAGASAVSAVYLGVTGGASLTVTAATLTHLQVEAGQSNWVKGTGRRVRATGIFSDGTKQDLTTSVVWSSSSTGTATVSNATGTEGLVEALAPGVSTISARFMGLSASSAITVSSVTVSHIALWPVTLTVGAGFSVEVESAALLSDNTSLDITPETFWSIRDTTVAGADSEPGRSGLVQGLAPGTTTLSATFQNAGAGTTVSVSDETITTLSITPSSSTMASGTTLQLQATAVFSDGTTQDVTSETAWTSSIPGTASVSNDASSRGLVRGIAGGTVTMTAACAGSTAGASIVVKSVSLSQLKINPSSVTLATSTSEPLTVTAIFSDGSSQDVTALATWSTSAETVAKIANGSKSSGQLDALSPGSATVTAQFLGISTTAPLTVTSASLQSLAISPDSASITVDALQPFKAIAIFSDHTTQDVTNDATWVSSNNSVAASSDATGQRGLTEGLGAGSAKVSAYYQKISATAAVNVTSAAISSILVTPASPSIAVGASQQFQAVAQYSDSTTADITSQVTWGSSNPAAATISNAAGSAGLATAQGAGTTTISALYMGNVGSTPLTVTSASGGGP